MKALPARPFASMFCAGHHNLISLPDLRFTSQFQVEVDNMQYGAEKEGYSNALAQISPSAGCVACPVRGKRS